MSLECVCRKVGDRPGVLHGKRCPYCDGSGDYAKVNYRLARHRSRRLAFVEQRGLVCQECGGRGGETEPILDDGSGPFTECGWCAGSGLMTPHDRGAWLRCKREEAAA